MEKVLPVRQASPTYISRCTRVTPRALSGRRRGREYSIPLVVIIIISSAPVSFLLLPPSFSLHFFPSLIMEKVLAVGQAYLVHSPPFTRVIPRARSGCRRGGNEVPAVCYHTLNRDRFFILLVLLLRSLPLIFSSSVIFGQLHGYCPTRCLLFPSLLLREFPSTDSFHFLHPWARVSRG